MKKLIYSFFTSIVILTFASCSQTESLSTAIPKDAAMVVKLDINSMIKKADYNPFKNEKINALKEMFKASLNDQQKTILDDFIKNPNSIGLNIDGSYYMFYTSKGNMGFVLGVADGKKLYNNILASSPESKELIKVDKGNYSLNDQKEGSVAWNSKKFVVIVKNVDTDDLSAETYLSLSKKESFYSTKQSAQIESIKSDAVSYYSVVNYTKIYSKLIRLESFSKSAALTSFLETINQEIDKYGLYVISTSDFENGKIVSKSTSYFDNEEAEKNTKNLASYNSKIDGNLMKFVEDKPIAYAVVRLEGEKILQDIKTLNLSIHLDSLSKAVDFDINSAIKVFNGDLVVSVDSLNFEAEVPVTYSVFANIDTNMFNSVVDLLIKKQKVDMVTKLGHNKYMLKTGMIFGHNNSIFYFSNNSATIEDFFKAENKSSSLAQLVENKSMYIAGDFVSLKNQILPNLREEISLGSGAAFKMFVEELLSIFTTFTYESHDLSSESIVNMSNQEQNSLKSIFEFIDKIVNGSHVF